MSLKDDMKQDMRNLKKDIELEVHKKWQVNYEGHRIEVINKMLEEKLLIDGNEVDRNKRKSLFSHIIPFSTLSGTIECSDGTKHKVSVKIGGFLKLNCIVKVNKKVIFTDALKLDFIPWEHKEKIVPYIQHQVEKNLVSDALPDDDYVYGENHPRMAAGLLDRLSNEQSTPFYVKKLLKLLIKQANHPSIKTRKATYEQITLGNVSSYVDEFIEQFLQVQIDESRIQQEALWLLEHAAHREVVKFAIVVLGCTDCEKYKEQLFTIGLHDEFTNDVIFALKNGTVGANEQVWRLAQSVHGWGKIAAVEHLDANTPEIKHWLLTKGCENTILNEYLASICAEKGNLDVALSKEVISKELYDGASTIIQALLQDSTPAENIDDYQYASMILSRFIRHAQNHCNTLEDFYPIMKIQTFLKEDEEVWQERLNNQWKQHERDTIQRLIEPIISDRKWVVMAEERLQLNYDRKLFEIAQFYQLDITAKLFALLEKEPNNPELYAAIMETNNQKKIRQLTIFAEKHLLRSNISAEKEDCLQYIVQDLHLYEEVGLSCLITAIESGNDMLQYHALYALDEWNPTIWKQQSVIDAIKKVISTSKDKETKTLAKQLLTK